MILRAFLFSLVVAPLASHGATAFYRNTILADSPLVYYEFDETGGSTATDSSPNGNNGTFADTYTWGSASGAPNLGTAVDLAGGGAGGYVDVPALGTLAQSTVEVWLQIDGLAGGCCTSILSSQNWAPGALHFNIKSGRDLEHALNSDSPVNSNTAANTILNGTWYHIVATHDNAANETKMYVNGVELPLPDHSGTQDVILGNPGLQLGAWNGGRELDGRIDEFAVYDTILDQNAVSAHYNAAFIPEPSGAILLLLGGALGVLRRRR